MRLIVCVAMLLLTSSAFAQQQDPEFLKRALVALQSQRNLAWDTAAGVEVKLTELKEELAKANARIKELELKEQK